MGEVYVNHHYNYGGDIEVSLSFSLPGPVLQARKHY